MKFFEFPAGKIRIIIVTFFLLILIMFGWAAISVIFFPAADEIIYQGEIIVSTCEENSSKDKIDLSDCITSYQLRVGNTGSNDQKTVRLRFPNLPSLKAYQHKMLDIFASTKKQPKATVKRIDSQSEKIYEISPFPENKLLVMSFFVRGYEDYRALKKMKVRIEAEGRVVKGNPRITHLARIFKKLSTIFF